VRADGARFLNHADGQFRVELLQADGEREASRACTDGDDVVLHHVTLNVGLLGIGHRELPGWLLAAVIFSVCAARGKSASMTA
jgi:hypothetical protein